MAKLTNRELSVVVDSIYKKIDLKREQYRETEAYQTLLTQAKIDLKYDEIYPLLEIYEGINEQINLLNNRRNEVMFQIRELRPSCFSNVYQKLAFDKTVIQEADKELLNIFPTKKDLEDDIILLSISGSGDIISTMLTKYGLNE